MTRQEVAPSQDQRAVIEDVFKKLQEAGERRDKQKIAEYAAQLNVILHLFDWWDTEALRHDLNLWSAGSVYLYRDSDHFNHPFRYR